MTELKITKGDFKVGVHNHADGEMWLTVLNGAWDVTHNGGKEAIACSKYSAMSDEENMANAVLFTDALNVANQTGLTPKQLLEQRDELLSAARWLWNFAHGIMDDPTRMDDSEQFQKIKAFIAKAEGRS